MSVTDTVALIYTTDGCTYCAQAKRYFNERSVMYIEYNIQRDPIAHHQFNQLVEKHCDGRRGVPLILLEDDIVEGFDKRKVDEILNGRELGNE